MVDGWLLKRHGQARLAPVNSERLIAPRAAELSFRILADCFSVGE
jgi:hypothetical protein